MSASSSGRCYVKEWACSGQWESVFADGGCNGLCTGSGAWWEVGERARDYRHTAATVAASGPDAGGEGEASGAGVVTAAPNQTACTAGKVVVASLLMAEVSADDVL